MAQRQGISIDEVNVNRRAKILAGENSGLCRELLGLWWEDESL